MQSAGYQREAVVRDYAFADYLGAEEVVRRVDLAAFSEVPPSYRSACVAVKRVAEHRVVGAELEELKALGAPRVITLGRQRAAIWTLSAYGEPQKIDDRSADEMPHVIQTSAADWSPQAMSRLAGLTPPGSYQLDFADLGLIPMIERQVNEKIDRLIREVLVGSLERDPSLNKDRRRYQELVRVVFQLLAAKVLTDRRHPNAVEPLREAHHALGAAQRHYGLWETADHRQTRPFPDHILDWAWDRIRRGFHFQNLSVDSLAFVYENSLVSPEVRRSLGIHGTPRTIAELLVGLLPLENLPEEREVILEPCAGFAPFLLAAMRRLHYQALIGLDPPERHKRLVSRLRGVELDGFAVEVGRLCLTLADYPNSDGWELLHDDVFCPGVLARHSARVGAVLANPPFEAFNEDEKRRYTAVRTERPAELLRRVLDVGPPDLLGFIVPRVLIDSPKTGYRDLRSRLRTAYREIDVVDLPDRLFEHSEAESVLLVARDRRDGLRTTLRAARIRPTESNAALEGRWRPEWLVSSVPAAGDETVSLRVDQIAGIWERLAHLTKLGDVAEIHRGIEYLHHPDQIPGGATSETPRSGYSLGAFSARDVRPYGMTRTLYLKVDLGEIRRGANHQWALPKVIANAARRRRGLWPLTAASDPEGRWCYQNLFGLWPTAGGKWPIAVITAVLNGPVANLFAAIGSGKRAIHRGTMAAIPLPRRALLDVPRIIDLVHYASTTPDLDTILRIDAEVLRGYDLPPRLERHLLSLFEGENRPGVPDFSGYYPADFDSAMPLHRILADLGDQSRARQLLASVPVFHDPAVSEMFDGLAAGFDR